MGSCPATATTQAHTGALSAVFAALLPLLALKSAWRDTAAKFSWQDGDGWVGNSEVSLLPKAVRDNNIRF